MKKFVYVASLAVALVVLILNLGALTKGAPCFTYVYSNSMEPLIQVNDGFLVWPVDNVKVGDIVLFRPIKLEAPLITHRVIELGREGFITKGDNSPIKDQMAGEPELTMDRVVGKVVTVHGKPVVVHGFGNIFGNLQKKTGIYTKFIAGALVTLGVLLALADYIFPKRKRKTRHRWRLRDFYRVVSLVAVGLVVVGVFFGSNLNQVRYLVSENPGDRGDHVPLGETGQITIKVKNVGVLPVWHFSSGILPIKIKEAPKIIGPKAERKIVLSVSPQFKPGWYQGYVRLYNYPMLLPHAVLLYLHQQSPYIALTAIGLSLHVWLFLFLSLMNCIPGLEGWIPLRALADKVASRRLNRLKTKLIGQRWLRNLKWSKKERSF